MFIKRVVLIALIIGAGGASQDHNGTSLYRTLCSECHMAYQPQLLPARSWEKIMGNLEDHFGVDATVEERERRLLTEYLKERSGDRRGAGELGEFAQSVPPNETPLRISETPYFKKEHREIPKRLVKQREVKSFANCTACHPRAQRGEYEPISIPNYGPWED